jgi:hypothetical protein
VVHQVGELSASLADQTLPTAELLLAMRGLAAFAGAGGLQGLGSGGGGGGSGGAAVAAVAVAQVFACVDRAKHQTARPEDAEVSPTPPHRKHK